MFFTEGGHFEEDFGVLLADLVVLGLLFFEEGCLALLM